MELLVAASVVLLVCVVCLLNVARWKIRSGKGKMPPGPAPLPILGNLLQVKPKDLAKTLEQVRTPFGFFSGGEVCALCAWGQHVAIA